jgi:hypothetical protein
MRGVHDDQCWGNRDARTRGRFVPYLILEQVGEGIDGSQRPTRRR